jgi:hypothetical protein
VDYDALCLNPEDGFHQVYRWLGWRWDEGVWEGLKPMINPVGAELDDRFFSVKKRSADRAYAWRRELAPHLIRRVQRAFDKLNLDYPFPGAGLPPLSAGEKASARRLYLQRRLAYLRQWGIRGILNAR